MKYIDLETYPRKSHYEYFKSLAYPYMGMTANVDVTHLVQYAKARGESTFLACLWAAAQAANAIPELRQRIVDEKIVEFSHCNTAHTVAMPDNTFANCQTDCRQDLDQFLIYGKAQQHAAMEHHGFNATQEDETNLVFVSCNPWVAFTQVIQPVPIPADCNPRIVMGKYIHEGNKILMPLHLLCNHALVDGRHLGQFFATFQQIADSVIP